MTTIPDPPLPPDALILPAPPPPVLVVPAVPPGPAPPPFHQIH